MSCNCDADYRCLICREDDEWNELRAEVERLRAERDAIASALNESNEVLDSLETTKMTKRQLRIIDPLRSKTLPHHAERVRLERAVVEAANLLVGQLAVHGWLNRMELGGTGRMAQEALDAHDRKEKGE